MSTPRTASTARSTPPPPRCDGRSTSGWCPAADQIDSAAADSSDGVLCVPALAGLAAPWWDSAATASFAGMTLSSGRGHLVRALMEGIAAQVAALADLVAADLGQPLTRLRVDGGLTRSAVLMQAQADLSRIPVDVYPSLHATALGAAACARLALDPESAFADAVGAWTPQHTYEPRWPADRAAEYLARWRRAAESVLRRTGDNEYMSGIPAVATSSWSAPGSLAARSRATLAGTALSVTLLEARDDVGDGTSKANTALLHTGFDATPGTLESRLVARGYQLLGEYAEQTGIPVERTGALLVAWTDEELDALPGLKAKAERNGYHRCEIVAADEVYRRVPDLGPGALAGLTVPGESIICTWTTNLALATDAVARGARSAAWRAGHRRRRRRRTHHAHDHPRRRARPLDHQRRRAWAPTIWTPNSAITASPSHRAAASCWCSTSSPGRWCRASCWPCRRRGARACWSARPSTATSWSGPTSENLEDRTATGTSEDGLEFLLSKGRALMPALFDEEITATYAGLRAAIDHDDYLIDVDSRAALRPRRRNPVHRSDVRDGDRRVRDGVARRGRPRRRPSAPDLPAAAADAQPRRGRAAPVPGRRTDRRRPGVRPHRLLLRAGDRRRDPRRVRTPPSRRPTSTGCGAAPG